MGGTILIEDLHRLGWLRANLTPGVATPSKRWVTILALALDALYVPIARLPVAGCRKIGLTFSLFSFFSFFLFSKQKAVASRIVERYPPTTNTSFLPSGESSQKLLESMNCGRDKDSDVR